MIYIKDNGGRRSGIERRTYIYTFVVPERRGKPDRRKQADRRKLPIKAIEISKERRRVFFPMAQ
ncbi:MAG: hypothetical protein QNI92_08870 [Desulfobacterales bacterium]|nr:hypothetical protein [Desulfobacterales bacterium]MDJ0914271.1 hypothetical protein [Desulfobacterales bacterium]